MDCTHYELYYKPSLSTKFYGTENELNTRIRYTGEIIVRTSDDYWIISQPPIRIITEYINGVVTQRITPDKYLYKVRKVKRITKQACIKLVDELNSGKIKFNKLF